HFEPCGFELELPARESLLAFFDRCERGLRTPSLELETREPEPSSLRRRSGPLSGFAEVAPSFVEISAPLRGLRARDEALDTRRRRCRSLRFGRLVHLRRRRRSLLPRLFLRRRRRWRRRLVRGQ